MSTQHHVLFFSLIISFMHEQAISNAKPMPLDRSCRSLQESLIHKAESLDDLKLSSFISTGLTPLTEAIAATAYARACNRFDPSEFIELLAPDCRYASQWVFDELVGRHAIADYLNRKMQMVKAQTKKYKHVPMLVELGKTTQGFIDRDCVIRGHDATNNLVAAVLFNVNAGRIIRYDLCLAKPLGIVRSGICPM